MGFDEPRINKKVDGNKLEKGVLERSPGMAVHNIRHGHVFNIKEAKSTKLSTLQAISTPGHRPDHLSYGLIITHDGKRILFPGDTILGSESVCFMNLELYMADLYRLKALSYD